MKHLLFLALFPGVALADASSAVRAAQDAAAQNALPASAESAAAAFAASGSTDSLEALYARGQGELTEPGSLKKAACLAAGSPDPECAAVQAVAGARTGDVALDASAALASVSLVEDEAQSLTGLSASATSSQVCSTVRQSVEESETRVCQKGDTLETVACSHGIRTETDIETLWRCTVASAKSETRTCRVPVTREVTALERCAVTHAVTENASCRVGLSVSATEDSLWQCVRSEPVRSEQTCTKTLSVTGTPSCTLGAWRVAGTSQSAALAADRCRGGDTLTLSVACSDTLPGALRLSVNTPGGSYSFAPGGTSFSHAADFSNCRGSWKGTIACDGSACHLAVTMSVGYILKTCSGDDACTTAVVPTGTHSAAFAWSARTLENISETWIDGCSALESEP